MKTPVMLAALAVFVANDASAAAPAGYVKRNGRKTAVTAVYAHREANTDIIVFDDRANATKAVEKKVYATTGDGVSADIVFYDLASKGGHPIELTIMDDAEHTVTDLALIESRNKPATHLGATSAKVEIERQDDEGIEGTATYDDGTTSMSLPFAIDWNRIGHAKAQDRNMPPPPPPPPPPSNPGAMLMMAADLLELEINDFYQRHGNAWPTSIDQVHKEPLDPEDRIASRTLGPNGVLTVVFAPDAPFVGGKTVEFTPFVTPNGIEWKCSGQGFGDLCQ